MNVLEISAGVCIGALAAIGITMVIDYAIDKIKEKR